MATDIYRSDSGKQVGYITTSSSDVYRSGSGKQVSYVITSSGDIYQSGKATKEGFPLLTNAPFAGLEALPGFPTVSTLGCLLSCADGDSCSYQREDEDSSGDHKGEMHYWWRRTFFIF